MIFCDFYVFKLVDEKKDRNLVYGNNDDQLIIKYKTFECLTVL